MNCLSNMRSPITHKARSPFVVSDDRSPKTLFPYQTPETSSNSSLIQSCSPLPVSRD
ncbi:hypothetical protein [Microcoleus sp. EPA2]|uniref:hypothetical protein n=1 Tax=Microcoleus sp. EPA2 TaxID=2841654 RepID=UPI00312B322A